MPHCACSESRAVFTLAHACPKTKGSRPAKLGNGTTLLLISKYTWATPSAVNCTTMQHVGCGAGLTRMLLSRVVLVTSCRPRFPPSLPCLKPLIAREQTVAYLPCTVCRLESKNNSSRRNGNHEQKIEVSSNQLFVRGCP